MRMRKKKNLAPRMERCGKWLIDDPKAYCGKWRGLKPDASALWLEIGCGKGRFTVEMAAQNPDVLYIALERVADAMIIAMERAREAGVENVRFIDADAAQLPEYFAEDEVDLAEALAAFFEKNQFTVDAVHDGQSGVMVALRGTDIVRVPLTAATAQLKLVPPERYAEAEVFFG